MRELTDKQERFVAFYLLTLNATEAARRAGYSDPSYGRELRTKAHVQRRIEACRRERAAEVKVNQRDVIRGMLREARTATSAHVRVRAWTWLGEYLGMGARHGRRQSERRARPTITINREEPTAHKWSAPADRDATGK
jgi:hypothetical protein